MNNWVVLDPSQFKAPPVQRGIDLRVRFSPYDFPSAVRGCWHKEKKKFCVEFKYLTEERTDRKDLGPHVVGLIGQHSQRLYGLEIDTQAAGVDAVQVQCVQDAVRDAFAGLKGKNTPAGAAARFQIAEDAIAQNSERLFTFAE